MQTAFGNPLDPFQHSRGERSPAGKGANDRRLLELWPLYLSRYADADRARRDYESRLDAALAEVAPSGDPASPSWPDLCAAWAQMRGQHESADLGEEQERLFGLMDEISVQIDRLQPDSMAGLIVKLSHSLHLMEGNDKHGASVDEHDWPEQCLMQAIADAERLAGGVL